MKNSCLLLLGLLTVITVSTVNAVAANLVGRVLDDTGLPVSHTWVVAYEPWQGLEEETLMDAQGRFDLSLPGAPGNSAATTRNSTCSAFSPLRRRWC